MSLEPINEMRQKIHKELSDKANLQHIKEWLKKEPHLPDEFDDPIIMAFLRGCKFSLEKTKRKMDMYFTMRTAIPEFFTNRDVTRPELQEILKVAQMGVPLPGRTPKGYRVFLLRGMDKNVPTPDVAGIFKLTLMLADIILLENEESDGVVFIMDASVATATHFAKFNPTLGKKMLICALEAYPIRVKEVHVINASPLVDTIVKITKPFIKKKIKERIFIHTDVDGVYTHVPKEMMPFEYGGNAGSSNGIFSTWVKKLEEYKDWFAASEKIKANETLRPGKQIKYDELFGIEGSFRQLTID